MATVRCCWPARSSSRCARSCRTSGCTTAACSSGSRWRTEKKGTDLFSEGRKQIGPRKVGRHRPGEEGTPALAIQSMRLAREVVVGDFPGCQVVVDVRI